MDLPSQHLMNFGQNALPCPLTLLHLFLHGDWYQPQVQVGYTQELCLVFFLVKSQYKRLSVPMLHFVSSISYGESYSTSINYANRCLEYIAKFIF